MDVDIECPQGPRIRKLLGMTGALREQGDTTRAQVPARHPKKIDKGRKRARRDYVGPLRRDRFDAITPYVNINIQGLRRLP